MEEEPPRVDASQPETSSVTGSTHTVPEPGPENAELFIPSFSPSSTPASLTPTGTLARLGLKSSGPTSPSAAAPGSPADRGQVSAITVVALLDKLVNMMEAVQDNQQRMEQKQADLESAIRVVQGDVSRLSKTHVGTSNSVCKLLERSRKVSGHLKEVRERLDKQAVQVKKLEANHSHLLKRNHFKVLIFQEDNEIPSSVLVKDSVRTPQPSQYDAESTQPNMSIASSVDGLQTISLSSDEDLSVGRAEGEVLEAAEGSSHMFERRSDKFKRSSLKKVDSLKKAFSRQSIEKKMAQITTKIVPPEKREKIIKTLSPTHPKSPSAKSSTFKVPPMTFNIKKVRDGDVPSQELALGEGAHVEISPLECSPGDAALGEAVVQKSQQMLSQPNGEGIKEELAVNGDPPSIQCEINGDRSAGLAVPEHDDDVGEDKDEEEDEEAEAAHKNDEKQSLTAATETVAVNQIS
ncbi:caveolae-associated protein 2-like [Corythoichthys intestinalis]|uniref:caveolae-associated protein 2-like n=1 Tax=Corythoichthys intestinalis TaxID=161448 RepID=UPI0025A67730|nr:caveolae-associated protein 2-like [Corythoichthys intestinalis]XP_061799625.1 caveolae-associated protein 2-like [Nerophis lumbriciformis]